MSEIVYRIDRSGSRKHTYITIQKDGSVLVKAGRGVTAEQIAQFVAEKERWIRKRVDVIREAQQAVQSHFYLLGEAIPRAGHTEEDIDRLYRQKAREIIPPLVERHSARMQVTPSAVSFRKNRSRWGSCSSQNRLSFNTRLAATPIDFIEYVVVHELAHIRHKNHSAAFWQEVARYLPDYKMRRDLVKTLHYTL